MWQHAADKYRGGGRSRGGREGGGGGSRGHLGGKVGVERVARLRQQHRPRLAIRLQARRRHVLQQVTLCLH